MVLTSYLAVALCGVLLITLALVGGALYRRWTGRHERAEAARRKARGLPLAPNTILAGRFRVLEHVGSGAQSRVYRAVDIYDESESPLAIKELVTAGELGTRVNRVERKEVRRWFKREVSALLGIDYPNIPKIHALWSIPNPHGEDTGPLYIVMDFVRGPTLEQVLDERGRIDWRQVAEWGVSLCKALSYLHGQTPPVLFRDIKLSNIILEKETGQPFLIDFGIATQLVTRAGQTAVGTPGYAPIEQWMGRAGVRSDQYAVGAVLHCLVSGEKASARLARLRASGLDMPVAMQCLFEPLDVLVPGVSGDFARAVTRATEYEANLRYASALDFGVALAEALVTAARASVRKLNLP